MRYDAGKPQHADPDHIIHLDICSGLVNAKSGERKIRRKPSSKGHLEPNRALKLYNPKTDPKISQNPRKHLASIE